MKSLNSPTSGGPPRTSCPRPSEECPRPQVTKNLAGDVTKLASNLLYDVADISCAALSLTIHRSSKNTIADFRRQSTSRIGSNVRSSRQRQSTEEESEDQEKKKKKKKRKKSEEEEEEEEGIDAIPIVCAVLIASVFGGPVCLIANLKLGMFAAIGGGIMGYTTGKMFSDHG